MATTTSIVMLGCRLAGGRERTKKKADRKSQSDSGSMRVVQQHGIICGRHMSIKPRSFPLPSGCHFSMGMGFDRMTMLFFYFFIWVKAQNKLFLHWSSVEKASFESSSEDKSTFLHNNEFPQPLMKFEMIIFVEAYVCRVGYLLFGIITAAGTLALHQEKRAPVGVQQNWHVL